MGKGNYRPKCKGSQTLVHVIVAICKPVASHIILAVLCCFTLTSQMSKLYYRDELEYLQNNSWKQGAGARLIGSITGLYYVKKEREREETEIALRDVAIPGFNKHRYM